MKLLLSLIILPTIVWAAASVSVTGVVRDQHGDLIEGALIEAHEVASGWTTATKTDSSGRYELKGLSPGEYRVSVYRAGFSTAARSIRLRVEGETISMDFMLTPGAIEDTVTVTAGKGGARVAADTAQAITVTGALEMETRRPASVTQALAEVPNLITIGSNPLAVRLRLRGLSSNRLLMIVDGERLNNVRSDPQSGISPAIVDVTQLESAEVLSGSGSSLYGSDAVAGTINLISKEPVTIAGGRYLGLRFDGDARSNGVFGRGAAALNFSTPRFALRAAGSLFRLDSYRAGGSSIPLAEVVRLGSFASEMSNAVGTNVARSFAVWELAAGGEVPNGQAHGFYSQLDAWLFVSEKQSIRYRQLSNQHKNIGFAFLSPPYDLRLQGNGFRRLDKYGLRYEGREMESRMPRIALSAYRQKYSFPDDITNYSINPGSSWQIPTSDSLPVLTGNASTFTPANFTDGKSSVTSYGADAQVTLALFKRARLTTGFGYLRDASVDEFSRIDFSLSASAPGSSVTGRASTPDSVYRNLSWSNLFEYEPVERVRLSASLRVDNWRTEAKVTRGFPLGTESAILGASFDALAAQPGGIDVEGASGILDLVNGVGGIKTSRMSVTGHAGLVLRLPGNFNPYFRWETSYREPGITERYILRNFGDQTFSVLLLPNTALKPERGNSYEVGLKIQRPRWRASFGYFRNNLLNFIRNEFSPALFVPPDTQNGLLPISPFFPLHGVLYVQRANTARARIQGVEANYELSLSLKSAGSITPFGTLGWLKGSNLTPDEQALTLIREFYNRADTPLRLRGSAEDVPLPGISPFGAFLGARYSDRRGAWVGEYDFHYRARVTRADPVDLTTAIGTQYGTFASLNSSFVQAVRVGYNFRRERYRLLFAAGVDNLTGRLYFEPFQTAPAPGRSLVFGLTLDAFDLLSR